jgi:hypothetical protein
VAGAGPAFFCASEKSAVFPGEPSGLLRGNFFYLVHVGVLGSHSLGDHLFLRSPA